MVFASAVHQVKLENLSGRSSGEIPSKISRCDLHERLIGLKQVLNKIIQPNEPLGPFLGPNPHIFMILHASLATKVFELFSLNYFRVIATPKQRRRRFWPTSSRRATLISDPAMSSFRMNSGGFTSRTDPGTHSGWKLKFYLRHVATFDIRLCIFKSTDLHPKIRSINGERC